MDVKKSKPPLTNEQKATGLFEGNSHPLVIKNPLSKKQTLYINPGHLSNFDRCNMISIVSHSIVR